MTTSATATVPARDGTPILVRTWTATDDPWASVLLVHGIAEHSGRYEHVGRQLAETGLEVIAYDQRGFGGSGGRRAFVDRWSVVHDDLEERLATLRSAGGGRPVVLFGHSLGGLIALGYVLAEPRRPQPDLIVLSAPALESTIPSWKRLMARVLGTVAPTLTIANAFDGAILSRDPTVGERYLADPQNQHETTTRFGALAIAEQARVHALIGRLSIPTLAYHGEDDHLVPTAASAPLAGVPGVIRWTYPRLRHESHNEPEGPAVIADVVHWLRANVPTAEGR